MTPSASRVSICSNKNVSHAITRSGLPTFRWIKYASHDKFPPRVEALAVEGPMQEKRCKALLLLKSQYLKANFTRSVQRFQTILLTDVSQANYAFGPRGCRVNVIRQHATPSSSLVTMRSSLRCGTLLAGLIVAVAYASNGKLVQVFYWTWI